MRTGTPGRAAEQNGGHVGTMDRQAIRVAQFLSVIPIPIGAMSFHGDYSGARRSGAVLALAGPPGMGKRSRRRR
jgi:ATP-dependent Lon protease